MPPRSLPLAARIEAELRPLGRVERAVHERAYLKSTLVHFGVSVPAMRRVTLGALRAAGELSREALLDAVDTLWGRQVHELRMAAVELLAARADLLRAGDVRTVERMIREARTWALADGLAIQVAGALVSRLPMLGRTLDRWARDRDFWLRRSAMLALLPGLHAGVGDLARFERYADAMLDETEFFVRKAIGWVLRETSKTRPEVVIRWLRPRMRRASGVTLREALKYLPARERSALLATRDRDGTAAPSGPGASARRRPPTPAARRRAASSARRRPPTPAARRRAASGG